MVESSARLQEVLASYGKFLREWQLASVNHQPHLVRWVQEFLVFAGGHGGYTFEQTLELFLTDIGGRAGMTPWQVQQATDAIRIYRYQFREARKAGNGGEEGGLAETDRAWTLDGTVLLARFREVLRLRHYARNTEKTYLHWARRFLEYRRETQSAGGRRQLR